MIESVGDRLLEIGPKQRRVVPVVDRIRLEPELLAHEVEERRKRRDRRRDLIALDTRDRGLGRSGPCRQLVLRQAVTAPCGSQKLSCCHEASISLLTYEGVPSHSVTHTCVFFWLNRCMAPQQPIGREPSAASRERPGGAKPGMKPTVRQVYALARALCIRCGEPWPETRAAASVLIERTRGDTVEAVMD